MGLGFSYGEAYFTYGRFNLFRSAIAEHIGINLRDMQGHGGKKKWEDIQDDLVPLLDHSDCDGELSVEECKQVSVRLREIAPDIIGHRADTILLAESMEEAIEANEPLKFC